LEALARSILDDAAETPEQDHFPHDLMSIVEPGDDLESMLRDHDQQQLPVIL